MLISATSIIYGGTRTKEIPVTQDQITEWQSGRLIQNAMPNITAQDRDFLKGIFWDEVYPDPHVNISGYGD